MAKKCDEIWSNTSLGGWVTLTAQAQHLSRFDFLLSFQTFIFKLEIKGLASGQSFLPATLMRLCWDMSKGSCPVSGGICRIKLVFWINQAGKWGVWPKKNSREKYGFKFSKKQNKHYKLFVFWRYLFWVFFTSGEGGPTSKAKNTLFSLDPVGRLPQNKIV